MKKLLVVLFFTLSSSFSTHCSGQYAVLHSFNDTDGLFPYYGTLTRAGNQLYGMTMEGGSYGYGVIFSLDTDGSNYTVMYSFAGINGENPPGSLVILNNKAYGMTEYGGAYSDGVIFSNDINTGTSSYSVLHTFNDTLGADPIGSLTSVGGKLYGTTSKGGILDIGTIFSIDTDGSNYRMIYDFDTVGRLPTATMKYEVGKLFGITDESGTHNDGIIFSIDTSGNNYRVLHSFNDTLGSVPFGSLTLSGNKCYGMTQYGGTDQGVIFSMDTDGTNYIVLHNFLLATGRTPSGGVTLKGSKLYGTASEGGTFNDGVLFSIDTNGNNYQVLINFDGTNGWVPQSDLAPYGNQLYGMTFEGGAEGFGVIFSISDTNVVSSITSCLIQSMSVFPNPNNGNFIILPSVGSEQLSDLEIYNVLGECVSKETLQSAQGNNNINISNQPNGVYFYRVIAENGGLIGDGKIVIEK